MGTPRRFAFFRARVFAPLTPVWPMMSMHRFLLATPSSVRSGKCGVIYARAILSLGVKQLGQEDPVKETLHTAGWSP